MSIIKFEMLNLVNTNFIALCWKIFLNINHINKLFIPFIVRGVQNVLPMKKWKKNTPKTS